MKMIIVIIRDEDRENITTNLVNDGFRVTRIASTGGFLKRGSTTLMIGVNDEKLDQALQIIRTNCVTTGEEASKRATLFVINVSNFEQI
mgnify:CR=1 FL=1